MNNLPSIADQVAQACEGATAFTLYGGYAVNQLSGKTVRFATGAQLAERRNDTGRVTYAKYAYADGSTLEYHYRADAYRLVPGRPS